MIEKNNNEIDFIEIFNALYKEKLAVILITTLCTLLACVYSLLLPNIYTSSSTLTIAESSGNQQETFPGFAGLSGLSGISFGGATSENSYAQTIIFSRQFLDHILSKNQIKHLIVESESYDLSLNQITFNKSYDHETKKWNFDKNGLSLEPSLLETHKTYKNMVSFEEDSETGYMQLSVSHISPVFAKNLLEIIINETNNLTRICLLYTSPSPRDS